MKNSYILVSEYIRHIRYQNISGDQDHWWNDFFFSVSLFCKIILSETRPKKHERFLKKNNWLNENANEFVIRQ